MVLVLVGSIVRTGQKFTGGARTAAAAPSVQATSATIDPDGVQRVRLSFGSFNYSPDTVRVKRGVPVEIVGDLGKLRGCFSSFVVPELNVWGQFTPKSDRIAFTPSREGTFKFSCAMGMGAGRIIVEA